MINDVSDNKIISLLRKDIKEKKVPIQRKIRVLVVEDEFGLQEILRDIFVMEGYNVRIATDGEEGYKAY
jgi:PleD family two-component response regulator